MNSGAKTMLFKPLVLREITLNNRVVISPMCQYSAVAGLPAPWHEHHLAALAAGGAGMVIMEATAVSAQGRITHGDLGVWSDEHAAALAPLAEMIAGYGAVPAIQLGHAGRKASMQRPWHGNGPLDGSDASRGELPWEIIAPSPIPAADGYLLPAEMTPEQIKQVIHDFAAAAKRVDQAGFNAIEIHGAHGYLVHSFLSPLTNQREDEYGGDLEKRMRFAIEVCEVVRANLDATKPLFYRISGVDGEGGGWQMEDSVQLAKRLREVGVDVIDCSSGGISAGSSPAAKGLPRGPGFQVPIASQLRREAGIKTQAVGLITDPHQAEQILQEQHADLVSIAREALYNPYWPHHAAQALGEDAAFDNWPEQAGWWLQRRALAMAKAGQNK